MYVRELMTPRVVAVNPGDTLTIARTKLRENRIHHLLVMDKNAVVGMLSYRDLIGREEGERVAEVMSRDVQTVESWATVRNAAAMMLGRTHGCLAVMERGQVTGIITTTDLLRAVTGGT
jgi:CBS domain-containing protein